MANVDNVNLILANELLNGYNASQPLEEDVLNRPIKDLISLFETGDFDGFVNKTCIPLVDNNDFEVTVASGDVVTLNAVSGTYEKSLYTDLIISGIASTENTLVQANGVCDFSGLYTFTVGSDYYVDETNPGKIVISSDANASQLYVGTAVTTTKLLVRPSTPFPTASIGLISVSEGGNVGYRRGDFNPLYYGNIGQDAVDVSYSDDIITPHGATGIASFASGYAVTASGDYSTAMGKYAVASGKSSVALGYNSTASGINSVAISDGSVSEGGSSVALGSGQALAHLSFSAGSSCISSAYGSTSLGFGSTASGLYSVALGYLCTASDEYSVSIGSNSNSSEPYSMALGYNCTSAGTGSIGMGYNASASNITFSVSIGKNVTASGTEAVALGVGNVSSGSASFTSGSNCLASGSYSVGLGRNSQATDYGSISIGVGCESSHNSSVALGSYNIASGSASFSTGVSTKSNGSASFSTGIYTEAAVIGTAVFGYGNIASGGYSISAGQNSEIFDDYSVGLGYSATAITKTNSNQNLTIKFDYQNGNGYFDGAADLGAADYAEYFETTSGEAIEAGLFVSFSEGLETIEPGNREILGIVSANPAVVGDSAYLHWNQKYLMDDFGRYIYQDVEIEEFTGKYKETFDENGNLVSKEKINVQKIVQDRILNPDYDPNVEYISRSERPEWVPIGLLGKLYVYSADGEILKVGDYVTSDSNGKAVKCLRSDPDSYRVMEVKESIVRVFFK